MPVLAGVAAATVGSDATSIFAPAVSVPSVSPGFTSNVNVRGRFKGMFATCQINSFSGESSVGAGDVNPADS